MRKRLCRSFSKPRDIVALQHHLQDVIVDNLNAALMMVGEDGLAPLACPWNEPPGEDTSPDPGKEKAAPKGVQQLRPSNLNVRDVGYITHIGLIDAAIAQRHIRALHFVQAVEIPERSERLRAEHLELIIRSEEHTSELQSLMRISYT